MSVSSIRSESPLVFQAAPNADSEEWVAAWRDVLAKGASGPEVLSLSVSGLSSPSKLGSRLFALSLSRLGVAVGSYWAIDANRFGRCHRLSGGGGGRGDERGGCLRGEPIVEWTFVCVLCWAEYGGCWVFSCCSRRTSSVWL